MLILASQSPRRRELLELAGLTFECIPSHAEEIIPEGLSPELVAEYLAALKAEDILKEHPDDVILGSDTIVVCDKKILGKPDSEEEAEKMLAMLSGRSHRVITGAAILTEGRREVFHVTTEVEFYELSPEVIRAYVRTGEPMDKAGAYGIQGAGSVLVREIRGDYYTVMGLPLAETMRRLPKEVLGGTLFQNRSSGR